MVIANQQAGSLWTTYTHQGRVYIYVRIRKALQLDRKDFDLQVVKGVKRLPWLYNGCHFAKDTLITVEEDDFGPRTRSWEFSTSERKPDVKDTHADKTSPHDNGIWYNYIRRIAQAALATTGQDALSAASASASLRRYEPELVGVIVCSHAGRRP